MRACAFVLCALLLNTGCALDLSAPYSHTSKNQDGATSDDEGGYDVDDGSGPWTSVPGNGSSASSYFRSDTAGLEISEHLGLGIPDDSSIGKLRKWLLVRGQFASSYDSGKKGARWTSWTLDSEDFGSATRASTFKTDPELPAGTPQATNNDYLRSGFSRGHLCPSADRTKSDADNNATFILTNILPQTSQNNAGPWLELENETRSIARLGKRLIVVAGPIYDESGETVGEGVAVPSAFFKVVVALDDEPTPEAVTEDARIYAVIMPNTTSITGKWREYQVTVREVEEAAGLSLLSDVPVEVQDLIENRIDR